MSKEDGPFPDYILFWHILRKREAKSKAETKMCRKLSASYKLYYKVCFYDVMNANRRGTARRAISKQNCHIGSQSINRTHFGKLFLSPL